MIFDGIKSGSGFSEDGARAPAEPGQTEPPARSFGGPGAYPVDGEAALTRLAGVLRARRARNEARAGRRGKRRARARCGAATRSGDPCQATAGFCRHHGVSK